MCFVFSWGSVCSAVEIVVSVLCFSWGSVCSAVEIVVSVFFALGLRVRLEFVKNREISKLCSLMLITIVFYRRTSFLRSKYKLTSSSYSF